VTPPSPFFSSPARPGATRRLLLVSPAFPPSTEVGALRWRRLADVLTARGWALDVVAGAAYPWEGRDERQLQTLPPNVRLWTPELRPAWPDRAWKAIKPLLAGLGVRRPPRGTDGASTGAAPGAPRASAPEERHGAASAGATESSARRLVASLARSYRARNNFAAWTEWCDRVERLGVAIAATDRPSVVVSSGPPHMAHEAARRLAARLGVPLVIDLRDPWFADHAEPADMRSRTWRTRTARYEAHACHAASRIVVNTTAAEQLMRARYPALADRVLVVMNGADPEVRRYAGRATRFEILHAGSLYGGRDPRVLFEAVRRFVERERPSPDEVRVTFIGDTRYEGEPLAELASRAGIGAWQESIASLPRDEALRRMGEAAVLVVLPQQWSASIPAKVFEYMQFDAWLLVMGHAGDAMTTLMESAGADVVAASDAEATAQLLARRFRDWKGGRLPTALNADGRYDRAVQAARLVEALEALG